MEEAFAVIRKKNLNLVGLGERLQAELEFKKKYCSNLEETLQNLTVNESFNLTQRYNVLKEANERLASANSELNTKIEDLIIQAFSEQEELRENFSEELSAAKLELANLKVDHEQKMQDLYTEMHMIQASAAVQSDETTTNLQHQLAEANAKLRETTSSLTNLKTELRTVKEEYAYYKSTVAKDTVELKRQLEWAEQQLQLAKSKQRYSDDQNLPSTSSNFFPEENSEMSGNNFAVTSTSNENLNKCTKGGVGLENGEVSDSGKYKPLQVYCKGSSSNSSMYNRNPPPLYKGTKVWGQSFKFQGVTKRPAPPLPPLMDVGATKNDTKSVPKKRKLYNPDDLTHLQD